MQRLLQLFCVAMLANTAVAGAAETAPFTRLFDGRSFDGWEGDRNVFRIEDGAIVGGNLNRPLGRNEFLCTKHAYDDFELRLKFRLRGTDANGGVQIRSQRVPQGNEVIGYQADLGNGCWGSLYDESRRKQVLAGPPPTERNRTVRSDDWNDYVIRCEGRRIQLWINGRQTVDYTESDASLPQTGIIGLQIHAGPAAEAWYKDIEIMPLTPGETRSPPTDFFPILCWGDIPKGKQSADSKKNGLESIAECNFNVAGFVNPEDLPACERLELTAIIRSYMVDGLNDGQIDERVRKIVERSANIKVETVKRYQSKHTYSAEDGRLVLLDDLNGHWLPAGHGVLVKLE
jgi:hypothetical protein